MYLYIGRDTVIPRREVIAVCDLDNSSYSILTRDFLTRAEKAGRVINAADDLPKSFVLLEDGRVYLSGLASSTLLRRAAGRDII